MERDRSEAEILRECLEVLAALPWVDAQRVNAGKRGGMRGAKKGTADILAVVSPSGRHAELEVKRPDGEQNESQVERMRRVRALGGFYAVVRSGREAFEAVQRCRAGETQ